MRFPTTADRVCLTIALGLATACSQGGGDPAASQDLQCAGCDSSSDRTSPPDVIEALAPPPLPHGQVELPPGSFFMGAAPGESCTSDGETPRHLVTLTRGFVAFDHEVTAAEWTETTGLPVPGLPPGADPQYFCTDPDCPVAWLNWFEAAWYANRLSEKDGLQLCYELVGCQGTPGTGCTGLVPCEGDFLCASVEWPDRDCQGWRLPTEGEWEYLARGGTDAAFGFPYPTGGGKNPNCTQCEPEANLEHAGWFCDNADLLPHPVRQLIPNAALVYDASGNVYEWCFDWKGDYPHHDVTDPTGPSTGQQRVIRGGSFLDNPRHCRLAYRNSSPPSLRARHLGLRLLHHAAGAPHPRAGQATTASELRSDPQGGPHHAAGAPHPRAGQATTPSEPRSDPQAVTAPLAPANPAYQRPPASPSGGSHPSYVFPAAPDSPPQPCTPAEGCEAGFYCGSEGLCLPCDNALHCGPECIVCTQPTPVCLDGTCAECPADNYCPAGKWCDSGKCVSCTVDDPAHCGVTCETCWGTAPACIDGHCRCAGDSCGPYQACDSGKCALCNTAERCGETCQPCPAELPFCRFDALGCARCLADSDCGPDMKCRDDVCIPDCTAEGCFGVPEVPGNDCSNPPVIGRVPLSRTVFLPGNTATGVEAEARTERDAECLAAGPMQVVSIYLTAGDRLSALLTPMDSLFDATLQVRSGDGCSIDAPPAQLLSCSSASGDGGPETLDVTAQADGWVTVVIGGVASGREPHDFGFYLLDLELECAREGCCCLQP